MPIADRSTGDIDADLVAVTTFRHADESAQNRVDPFSRPENEYGGHEYLLPSRELGAKTVKLKGEIRKVLDKRPPSRVPATKKDAPPRQQGECRFCQKTFDVAGLSRHEGTCQLYDLLEQAEDHMVSLKLAIRLRDQEIVRAYRALQQIKKANDTGIDALLADLSNLKIFAIPSENEQAEKETAKNK